MLQPQLPFKSIQEQVKARVFSLVDAKIKSLRTIQSVVVDVNFLVFLNSVDDFENFVQDTLLCPWTTVSSYTQSGLRQLDDDKRIFLSKVKKLERELDEIEDSNRVLELFVANLNKAYDRFQEDYEVFLDIIDDFSTRRVQEIYAIYEIENKLVTCNHLKLVIENNLRNCKRIATVDNVRDLWSTNLDRLTRVALDRFFQVSLAIRNRDHSVMAESPASTSRNRIREELRRISETHASPEELQKLRQQLVLPTTPLVEQKQIVQSLAERKEEDLSIRIQSVDELQTTIEELEAQVQRLREESNYAQEQLKKKREKLTQGLIELLRLEKLIEQIDKEISEKKLRYQNQLAELEMERLRVINNPNLDQVTKNRFLKEVDQAMRDLRAAHTQEIEQLQQKKEGVKQESRAQAQVLQTVMRDLRAHHKHEMKELEQRKIGASPSEVLRIEEEMRLKQQQFEANVKQVQQVMERPEYYFDENGRYYLNDEGVKIYKHDSFASEKILSPDGTWTTIKPGVELLHDEKGNFYLDQFGNKIYKMQLFKDEKGDYYLNEQGNRVYIESGSESDGASAASSAAPLTSDQQNQLESDSGETLTSCDSDERRRQDNIQYLMSTLGRPLRLGLASITLRQPTDPINHLANFLIQYRYNEMRHEESDRQLEELLAMREQLRRDDELWEEDSIDGCHVARRFSRFQ